MKTVSLQISTLCILLALSTAAAQCNSPDFTDNVIDLHELKAQGLATRKDQKFGDDKEIKGYSIVIPSTSNLPTVPLASITSVDNFGCNTDIENAHVFKLRLVRGDSTRFFILNEGRPDTYWKTRRIWQTRLIPRS